MFIQKYKVFSPNSDKVQDKEFLKPLDAITYYQRIVESLMHDPYAADIKIQCETKDGLLIKRATILNDLANRCAIESALRSDCDIDNDPRYDINHLTLKS